MLELSWSVQTLYARPLYAAKLMFRRSQTLRGKVQSRKTKVEFSMTSDDIQLLYKYDRWANNGVLKAVSELSSEQFTRDLGGSFRSVRDTLVHIISGEWGWLTYWKEPSDSPTFLKELRNRLDTLFNPEAFPNIVAVQLKWAEVEREQIEFVSRLTDEALGKMLPFRAKQFSLMHLMQHLANHSTYHRGQVALMMRQLGAQPAATDFHVFLAENFDERVAPAPD